MDSHELAGDDAVFLDAWKAGVNLAGPTLFGCQARTVDEADHWRELAPKLDVMRRMLPNRPQSDAAFAAAMASFFNATEGHKLAVKVGAPELGRLVSLLDRRQRTLFCNLTLSFKRW